MNINGYEITTDENNIKYVVYARSTTEALDIVRKHYPELIDKNLTVIQIY